MESNITLQQLIYLVAVDSRGSFVDAAEECRVSQPALSMQIRKLENSLGVQVFDRSRQPIVATDIGRRIIAQARMTLREAERVQELVDLAQGEIKGEYRLGVERTVITRRLVAALRDFNRQHAGVRLRVREMSSEEIIENVGRDRLDAAILPLPVGVETFVERTLYYEPLVAYLPREHPLYRQESVSLGELASSHLLLPRRSSPLHRLITNLLSEADIEYDREKSGSEGIASGISEQEGGMEWEGGEIGTLRRLTEEGVGPTLLPALTAEELRNDRTADMLREFADPVPYRSVGLIHTGVHNKGHITEELQLILLAHFPVEYLSEPERQA